MTTKEFIEKAIVGGWKQKPYMNIVRGLHDNVFEIKDVALVFLDPKAWEAVGKVIGWSKESFELDGRVIEMEFDEHWKNKMHAMIDALIEGKTIEEFLSDILIDE